MYEKNKGYCWGIATSLLLLMALFHYVGSKAPFTDLPNEMTLSKTSGTLHEIHIARESKSHIYRARVDLLHEDGKVSRFTAPSINHAIDRFASLSPGDKLEIVYRADRPVRSASSGSGPRIMDLRANGILVWAMYESAAISAIAKKEHETSVRYCLIGALFTLLMTLISYRSLRKASLAHAK